MSALREYPSPVTYRRILSVGLLLLTCDCVSHAQVSLPTPAGHYAAHDVHKEAEDLLETILAEIPQAQALLLLTGSVGSGAGSGLPPEVVKQVLATIPLDRWRPRALELLVHNSQVLELLADGLEAWIPVTHDALLFYLDHLGEERFLDLVAGQAALPVGASRGERLLQLVSRSPALQKLGQILAHNPVIPEDFRSALQMLENSIQTTDRDELLGLIEHAMGNEAIARYRIAFADEILAEASVGAVIEATLVLPGETTPKRAVCKVIKPRALQALEADLTIFEGLSHYLSEQGDFYRIGEVPLADMFQELKIALSREVMVREEQKNLVRARQYYSGSRTVLVPELYPASTETVTFMEFIEGEKISKAFPNDKRARRVLAKRLADALTFDVLFSSKDPALFHGDPHAGNVFHAPLGTSNPYRIALLDWGLLGTFTRQERKQLVQLFLGAYLRDKHRLKNHIRLLTRQHGASPVEEGTLEKAIAAALADRGERSTFGLLEKLMAGLTIDGYHIPFNLVLFIKSQVTIDGILKELDPSMKPDDYLLERLSGRVWKELPKRVLYGASLARWNSHNYKSLLSNEDIRDFQNAAFRRRVKAIARGVKGAFR